MYLLYVLPSSLSVCVSEHQNFLKVPYGKKLKINLILNSSLVDLYYTRDSDKTTHLLLEKGKFTDVTGASYFFCSLKTVVIIHCLYCTAEKGALIFKSLADITIAKKSSLSLSFLLLVI